MSTLPYWYLSNHPTSTNDKCPIIKWYFYIFVWCITRCHCRYFCFFCQIFFDGIFKIFRFRLLVRKCFFITIFREVSIFRIHSICEFRCPWCVYWLYHHDSSQHKCHYFFLHTRSLLLKFKILFIVYNFV